MGIRKNRIVRLLIPALILLICSCTLTAQTNSTELNTWKTILTPDSTLVKAGALKDPVEATLMARAALIVSGVPADRLATYERKLKTVIDNIVGKAKSVQGNAARAEAALVELHAGGVFKHYEEESTTLIDILDKGTFNCVSSAVMYLLVLKNLGIQANGVDTPDHAFVIVDLDGRKIDVETTNRHGFDPGSKKDFTDEFGRVTGFSYVPPGEYAKREIIGQKALVSLIASNRVVALEKKKDYPNSLRLGVEVNALRNDSKGKQFLLDRINNMMVQLYKDKDYINADALANAAVATLGKLPELKADLQTSTYNLAVLYENSGRYTEALQEVADIKSQGLVNDKLLEVGRVALHNLIQKLLQQGDITAARAAYDTWDSVIGTRLLKDIESQIIEAELINAAQSKPFREALATLDKAVANGYADKGRIEELVLYLYGKEANRIAATGDWLAAADIALQGVKRVPGNAQLTQAAAGFRKNYVITIHNKFAQLFNAKQYEQARTLLLEALKTMPDDKTLLDDLKTVQAQLK